MSQKYPFKRDFYEDVVKSIQKNDATFVLGPRRCGKTVCLTQIRDAYENTEYVDFKEIPEEDGRDILLKIQKSIEKDEDKVYLLDEITYAPNPEKAICRIAHLFTENASENTKVVFSGSQSLALDKWGHIAFSGGAGFVRTNFISYAEWMRYKGINSPSKESYEKFLYDVPKFCKITTMEEYLQSCLDETIVSNNKTSNYLHGNDCELLTTDVLLSICYTTLFTLHNHVSDVTFAKGGRLRLKDDISHYFGEVCKELNLDRRISSSFVEKYDKLQKTDWRTMEQAFLFLRNCGLITITRITNDLEDARDIGRDFRMIAYGKDSETDFKGGMFRDFNMCIKYPAFYVAILKDILGEDMPDHLPNDLLGSIVECHVRGMLPEQFALEYHDNSGEKETEVDYVNTVSKIAVESSVSNKPMSRVHFDVLPEDYRKILLTKDRSGFSPSQGVTMVPYYDFLYNRADFNAYTKESGVQKTERVFGQSSEESVSGLLNSCDNDSLGMGEDDNLETAVEGTPEAPKAGPDIESP